MSYRSVGLAGVVTLSGPPMNALSTPMIESISEALSAFESSGAGVLVIDSALPTTFIAGADIKEMQRIGTDGFKAYGATLRQLLDRIAGLGRPSIAAIDGLALGGGLELALACGLRVGTRQASLGLPEPRLGLIPGAGGTQRLPLAIGRARALDLLLTARTVDGEEAMQIGLLNRLVGPGQATEAALEIAEQMSRLSRSALEAILRVVDTSSMEGLAAGLEAETREVEELFVSGDAGEGLTAFLEKRTPAFSQAPPACPVP